MAPRARGALFDRHVAPGVAARLAGRGRGEELPEQTPGHRVVRGDEAVLALALLAGPVGQHLAVGDEDAARLLAAIVELELPALLTGLGVDRDQEAVGRGEIDHVLIDADALLARDIAAHAFRISARVFPDQIAVRGIDRLDGGAGREQIHDAAIDDRRRFLDARGKAARPRHPELARRSTC